MDEPALACRHGFAEYEYSPDIAPAVPDDPLWPGAGGQDRVLPADDRHQRLSRLLPTAPISAGTGPSQGDGGRCHEASAGDGESFRESAHRRHAAPESAEGQGGEAEISEQAQQLAERMEDWLRREAMLGRHRALVRCPAGSIRGLPGPSDLIDNPEPGQSADPQAVL